MKRVYLSPTIDGIYVLNYKDVPVKRKRDNLSTPFVSNNATTEAVRKEGYQQGLNDAMKKVEASKEEIYRKGIMDGSKQAGDKLSTAFQVLQDTIRQLQQEKSNIWQKSETEIVKLVLAIAQKIVGYEVTNNNYMIEKVVAEAISYVGKHKIVSIRMNPADIAKLKNAPSLTLHPDGGGVGLGPDNTFELVADQKISPGGCMVETDFGCIDAQLESRINKVINQMLTHSDGGTGKLVCPQ